MADKVMNCKEKIIIIKEKKINFTIKSGSAIPIMQK